MRLFKKHKIDYNLQFKEQYKSLNKIHQKSLDEPDYKIKASLLQLCIVKYQQLLDLIDKGASFDRHHIETLKKSCEREYKEVKEINENI